MRGHVQDRRFFEKFEMYASEVLDGVYQNIWPGSGIDHEGDYYKDKVLYTTSGIYRIEEKHRGKVRGDMLVELVQDALTMKPGWFFYNKDPDLKIVYAMFPDYFKPLDSAYWVDNGMLHQFVENPKNWNRLRWPSPSRRGIGVTVNCAVPWTDLVDFGAAKKMPVEVAQRELFESV